MMNKEFFMREALKEALKSYSINEVPIGCVIVKDGQIIARAHNNREQNKDPLGHAELIAIKKAAKHLGGWRLVGCDMYVTLEPCIMCSGAIMDSRIENLYIGAMDPKRGCVSSYLPILKDRMIPHNVNYEYIKTISPYIIKRFFRHLRRLKKESKNKI